MRFLLLYLLLLSTLSLRTGKARICVHDHISGHRDICTQVTASDCCNPSFNYEEADTEGDDDVLLFRTPLATLSFCSRACRLPLVPEHYALHFHERDIQPPEQA